MPLHQSSEGDFPYLSESTYPPQSFPIQHVHEIATSPFDDLESLLSATCYPVFPPLRTETSVSNYQAQVTLRMTEKHPAATNDSPLLKRAEQSTGQLEKESLPSASRVDRYTDASTTEESKKDVSTNQFAPQPLRLSPFNLKMGNLQQKRRKQVRLAQRAYQRRKASTISSLTNRTMQLESALSDMASTMAQLRGVLRDCNAQTTNPQFATLYRASEKCLSLVNELDLGSGPLHPSAIAAQRSRPATADPARDSAVMGQTPVEDIDGGCFVGYSAFMERLRISIAHFGYRALINNVATPGRISRPMWLLGTVMSAERMAAFFAASVHCRIMRVDLGREWDDVPIFSLGDGTDCPASSETASSVQQLTLNRERPQWRRIQVPFEALPADLQDQYRGDWLDADQLEEYLRTRRVQLYSPPSNGDPRGRSHINEFAVNITRLMAGMGPLSSFPFNLALTVAGTSVGATTLA
ncbi:hypothetical protein PWT90_11121 [Aphanocladium album]|nr:hypothetical protein PWT90_11121 [Aphanocladium album]